MLTKVTFLLGVTRLGLAHAWVQHDGNVVIGGAFSPARYKPLLPIESRSST